MSICWKLHTASNFLTICFIGFTCTTHQHTITKSETAKQLVQRTQSQHHPLPFEKFLGHYPRIYVCFCLEYWKSHSYQPPMEKHTDGCTLYIHPHKRSNSNGCDFKRSHRIKEIYMLKETGLWRFRTDFSDLKARRRSMITASIHIRYLFRSGLKYPCTHHLCFEGPMAEPTAESKAAMLNKASGFVCWVHLRLHAGTKRFTVTRPFQVHIDQSRCMSSYWLSTPPGTIWYVCIFSQHRNVL